MLHVLKHDEVLTTIIEAKLAYQLHLSHWHSEMDWNIATPTGTLTAAMINLHRVKSW